MSNSIEDSSTFPVEIYERIIDRIPYHDLRDSPIDFQDVSFEYALLCACALTCRAWVPRSRVNLYRSISIKDSATVKSLCASLNLRPQNGNFVQLVQVRNGTALSQIALHFPRRMKNIQVMEFVKLELTKIHPTLFFNLSKFKSITQLGFKDVAFDGFSEYTKFVTAFPNVTRLYLSGTQNWGSVFDIKTYLRTPQTRRFKPSELHMDFDQLEAMESPCQWLAKTGATRSLAQLDFMGRKCSEGETKAIETLLTACGRSVRVLKLALDPRRGKDFASLRTSPLHHHLSLGY